MDDEQFPRVYEGEALKALNLGPVSAELIHRVIVGSPTTMVIDVPGQTIAVTVHRPLADDRPWTIRIEHTMLADNRLTFREAGSTTVVAEALSIEAVDPRLPDGKIIDAAMIASAENDARDMMRVKLTRAFHRALKWLYPGGSISVPAALALNEGRATVAYELDGPNVIVTLRINAGADLSFAATDIFD